MKECPNNATAPSKGARRLRSESADELCDLSVGTGSPRFCSAVFLLVAAASFLFPATLLGEDADEVASRIESRRAEVMGLAELEEMALRCNPTLAQAAARVEAARAEWIQAGLLPNPRAGYDATEIGDEGQSGQQGAFVSQEFITAHKLRRSRDVAAQAIRQAEWAMVAQRRRVETDVRQAFYEVLAAQRRVELTGRLVQIGQEGVRAAETLLQAKERSRVDVLQARIETDSARILAEKAANRHAAAWRNLAAIVGAPDMPVTVLTGELHSDFTVWTWDAAFHRALDGHPSLAEARAGVSRAEAAVRREIAGRTPNIDARFGVYYDNATRDSFAAVEAGLPLPLFNRNQGNIRRAEADLAAARNESQRVALELQQRLAVTFEQYQNAQCQVEKYVREILPNAKTSLDLVLSGYQQGEFDYVTLLTAQRVFFQVNLAYIDALRDLRTAEAAVDGSLLGGSLQPH